MNSGDKGNKNRILTYLAIPLDGGITLDDYCDDLENIVTAAYINLLDDLRMHPVGRLQGYIYEYLIEEGIFDPPASIQLYEDQIPLLAERCFSMPYMLHRAIYIDTPYGISSRRIRVKSLERVGEYDA